MLCAAFPFLFLFLFLSFPLLSLSKWPSPCVACLPALPCLCLWLPLSLLPHALSLSLSPFPSLPSKRVINKRAARLSCSGVKGKEERERPRGQRLAKTQAASGGGGSALPSSLPTLPSTTTNVRTSRRKTGQSLFSLFFRLLNCQLGACEQQQRLQQQLLLLQLHWSVAPFFLEFG